MRLPLLATSVVLAGSFALIACSSADETDATEDQSTNVPERTGALGGDDTAPASPPPANEGPGEDEEGEEGDPDGGGGGNGDGGGGGGGGGSGDGGGGGGNLGSKCANNSVQETESNDSAATADTIPNATGSFCGTLSTTADVDFVTFTLPADATFLAFGAEYSRNGADFDVTVNSATFKIGQTPQVVPGAKYVIKAFTTGNQPLAYRIDVEIKK